MFFIVLLSYYGLQLTNCSLTLIGMHNHKLFNQALHLHLKVKMLHNRRTSCVHKDPLTTCNFLFHFCEKGSWDSKKVRKKRFFCGPKNGSSMASPWRTFQFLKRRLSFVFAQGCLNAIVSLFNTNIPPWANFRLRRLGSVQILWSCFFQICLLSFINRLLKQHKHSAKNSAHSFLLYSPFCDFYKN